MAAVTAPPTPAALLDRHRDAWARATAHPFLAAARDGSLAPRAFDAWLVQDHVFVTDLVAFQARLVPRVGRGARRVLVDGLAGLVAELRWFEQQAGDRGLDLRADPDETTTAYADLLERLLAGPPAAALTALWALERAYLDAWATAAPGDTRYRSYVEHWTTPAFAAYVADLERLASADAAAEAAFLEVTALEERFWSSALVGGAA